MSKRPRPTFAPDGILGRIQNYLGNGGLFNPEMMEHDKVRDLIMACRDEITRLAAERDASDKYAEIAGKTAGEAIGNMERLISQLQYTGSRWGTSAAVAHLTLSVPMDAYRAGGNSGGVARVLSDLRASEVGSNPAENR